ncbi:MAG: type II secretion system protein [Pirellulales bacterium]|nr:type II secretion system protein [Pirellulales bacterium]
MSRRSGFTLVELVVVVMILGILAAVAAPKLISTSGTAADNGVRQTLSVVRDAIERFAADHGGQIPTAAIATELKPYLRGNFPKCPVGDNAGSADIATTTTSPTVANGGTEGWMYNTLTGDFIINSDGFSNDGVTTYEEF